MYKNHKDVSSANKNISDWTSFACFPVKSINWEVAHTSIMVSTLRMLFVVSISNLLPNWRYWLSRWCCIQHFTLLLIDESTLINLKNACISNFATKGFWIEQEDDVMGLCGSRRRMSNVPPAITSKLQHQLSNSFVRNWHKHILRKLYDRATLYESKSVKFTFVVPYD